MKSRLVLGTDYYLEDGKLVFTSAYHLKRGFCCNSGCRHCPYRDESTPEVVEVKLKAISIPGLARSLRSGVTGTSTDVADVVSPSAAEEQPAEEPEE
jgi:hypothetical protein